MKQPVSFGDRRSPLTSSLPTIPGNSVFSPRIPPPLFFLFLKSDHPSKKGQRKTSFDPDDERSTSETDGIICRQCLHAVTSVSQQIEVNGSHRHTFANPEGIVFEIGCYKAAWGCGYVGGASTEFAWFAGYSWRIAVCANCQVHLGWFFSGPNDHLFHGLITDRLSIS